MSQEIIPRGETPFAKLSVAERDHVLLEISKSLHYSALMSKIMKDRAARHMEALADWIDHDHERMAADYSAEPSKVVLRALELMENLDRRMMPSSGGQRTISRPNA
ncbi:hypothetical protein [Rhizobium ruizarguesonis]|uniref:hypothetical protein n=1 Tax=Rhizobium ruizarguesonis TaxID=2081791 RepID=UPI001030AFB2|nr:hypothetical protein [Rhizobium ruizarguesonis]TAT69985.1 hypothetical protein ELI52_38590 [Rhizobium ruizarguesonis]